MFIARKLVLGLLANWYCNFFVGDGDFAPFKGRMKTWCFVATFLQGDMGVAFRCGTGDKGISLSSCKKVYI